MIDGDDVDFSIENVDVQAGTEVGIGIVNSSGSYEFTAYRSAGTDNAFAVLDGSPDISVEIDEAGITSASGYSVSVVGTTSGSITFTGGPIVDSGRMCANGPTEVFSSRRDCIT